MHFRKARIVGLLAGILIAPGLAFADDPHPPCAEAPVPSYATAGKEPSVQAWSSASLTGWELPTCLGWNGKSGDIVVALAGTTSLTGDAEEILRRFGAISTQRGIRYRSVTDKAWRVLISGGAALEGSDQRKRRDDFRAAEMEAERDLFFVQKDTRSTGEVVYRLRVREFRQDHFLIEMENVTPVKIFVLTIFKPGGMKFVYFLDRRLDRTWNLYALMSATGLFVEGKEASFINRAVAFYRHFIGVPTDVGAPLAP